MHIISTNRLDHNRKSIREDLLAEALLRLHRQLTKRAYAIVGNHSDAEDAVQETAVRAWRARERLRADSDPTPWLNTILTRVAIDLLRVRSRRAERSLDDSILLDRSPDADVIRAETIQAINSAAARLSPSTRRAFLLHDVDGFTSHEIAALDNVPYDTVRTRLRRARTSLRNELREAV
jgi:RNA polymerase sigma-70 factor (ECF subfamily)